jgi:hypothetical protein
VKYLLFSLLIFSCDQIKEQEENNLKQETDTLQFLEYNDFESVFKSSQDMQQLVKDYDFRSILLLDSTMAKALYEFDPELKEDFHSATLASSPNESIVRFRTDFEKLRDLVLSKTARTMFLSCIYGEQYARSGGLEIRSPVYIKGNTAVVEIITKTTSDLYYFTLLDGVVQINLLQYIIED